MTTRQHKPNIRTALIAGSTGLIGSICLQLLLNDDRYSKVTAITRRPLNMAHPHLENLVVDFENLEEYRSLLSATDVYCCLGTTIKQAGSKDAFKKVDYHYVVNLARIAREQGAEKLMLVSAVGVDAQSRIFYNAVKGQVERDVKAMGYPALHIFKPSLLLGNRKEFRLGERIAAVVMKLIKPVLAGGLSRYKPISGNSVAKAMRAAAFSDQSGIQEHEYRSMMALVKKGA